MKENVSNSIPKRFILDVTVFYDEYVKIYPDAGDDVIRAIFRAYIAKGISDLRRL